MWSLLLDFHLDGHNYQLWGPQKVPLWGPRRPPEDLQSSSTAFLTKAKTTTANSLICWSFVFQQPKSIITIIIMILRVIFKRYHRSWNCCRTFFVIINLCIAHIRSKITFYLILFQFSWFLTLVSTEQPAVLANQLIESISRSIKRSAVNTLDKHTVLIDWLANLDQESAGQSIQNCDNHTCGRKRTPPLYLIWCLRPIAGQQLLIDQSVQNQSDCSINNLQESIHGYFGLTSDYLHFA